MTPEYSHTQKAPLCLLIYPLAIGFFIGGVLALELPTLPWLFLIEGVLTLIIAASFHHLTIEDRGEVLAIRFGPLPLFRRTVRYSDIGSVEAGRTTILDGWGIHYRSGRRLVWNIWGRDCVVIHFKNGGALRIGTDDAENLVEFLGRKVRA